MRSTLGSVRAVKKKYHYYVLQGPHPATLLRADRCKLNQTSNSHASITYTNEGYRRWCQNNCQRYAWYIPKHLDVAALDQAMKRLCGTHDFRPFAQGLYNAMPYYFCNANKRLLYCNTVYRTASYHQMLTYCNGAKYILLLLPPQTATVTTNCYFHCYGYQILLLPPNTTTGHPGKKAMRGHGVRTIHTARVVRLSASDIHSESGSGDKMAEEDFHAKFVLRLAEEDGHKHGHTIAAGEVSADTKSSSDGSSGGGSRGGGSRGGGSSGSFYLRFEFTADGFLTHMVRKQTRQLVSTMAAAVITIQLTLTK
jgi:uncharacterized membrane protein YgcG